MKALHKNIEKFLSTLFLAFLLGSCTADQQDKSKTQERISDKIAALKTTLAQKQVLTAHEKTMLKNMAKSYEKASVTVGEQNSSFNFDDLSSDHIEFNAIEQVPVFESCATGDRAAQRACVETFIASFVTDNYDISAGENLEISGLHEIDVSFIIDTDGAVKNIKTRLGEKALQEEAARVIAQLPKMRPGAHKGKTIAALYSMPILFEVP